MIYLILGLGFAFTWILMWAYDTSRDADISEIRKTLKEIQEIKNANRT